MRVDAVVANEAQLARLAATRFSRVAQLAQTTSTNSVLLGEAEEGAAEGLVVVADHQSAGRGRFDRRWESPAATSLLMSVLLRPPTEQLPPPRRHLAVAAVSLAVVEAALAAGGVVLALKWPNDLVADGGGPAGLADAKVAGVLAETVGAAIVVGIGVNVHWAPPGERAVSLDALAGTPVDRGDLLVESLLALDRLYGRWDEVSRRYRDSCATLGRRVTVSFAAGPGAGLGVGPSDLEGTAVDLEDDGRLVVQSGTGARVVVAAGDVSHAGMAPAPRVVDQ